MSRIALGVLAVALFASTAHADTTIAGGNLPGASNTWTLAGSPYIIQGDLTIPTGATLTIEAGVEVRATANSDSQGAGDTSHVELNINGSLFVNGTANSPVVFHSSMSSTGTWYGIVVNASATEVSLSNARIEYAKHGLTSFATGSVLSTSNVTVLSAQTNGVWLHAGTGTLDSLNVVGTTNTGINIADAASPTLTNCIVRTSTSYGIYIQHSTSGQSVTLDNCTLNQNGSINLYVSESPANAATVTIKDSIITSANYGVYKSDAGSTVTVTNSNVWNNSTSDLSSGVSQGAGVISQNPLYVSPSNMRLTSNSPSRFGATGGADQGALPYISDATPGLYGTLWSNTTLAAANGPYTLEGDLTIAPTVTLTIEPGTTLMFRDGMDIMRASHTGTTYTSKGELIVQGRLVADGTANAPITIRSTTTTTGSWVGIVFDTTAHDSIVDNVTISRAVVGLEYASTGANNVISNSTSDTAQTNGLWLRSGALTIDGWSSIGTTNTGINIADAASPTLVNCIVRTSTSYGIYIQHSTSGQTVTIDNCTLNQNGSINVYVSESPANAANVTIKDSIITSANYGVYKSDAGSTVTVTNSNVWNNSTSDLSSGVSQGAGVISQNPLYVSPSNMRLTSNSPSRFGATGGADQGALPYTTDATPGLWGTLWTNTNLLAANGPYTLEGDLTVAPNVTLTIEPGTTLMFRDGMDIMRASHTGTTYTSKGELIVKGRLVADGTPASPITIRSTTTTTGSWVGIFFDTTAHDSIVDNVTISRAVVGLEYVSTGANNVISNSTSDTAQTNGLWLRSGALTIDGWRSIGTTNTGINIADAASPTLVNCVVRNSTSYGIYIQHSTSGQSVTLTNCTLNLNGSINVYVSESPANAANVTIKNSIITSANYGVYKSDAGSTVTVSYSDVWNNSTSNLSSGVSQGTGVISQNPLFVSTSDLHLQGTSVAIDSGTTGPNHDADGIARPLDGDGIAGAQYDMGAYEFVLMAQCGNGSVEPGEFCDSGTNNGMYGYCNANCTALGPRCGDGMMNGNEQCDDANSSNGDACLNTCMTATCGDGFVRAGTEQCDDGNQFNTDACTNQCMTATCGDGYVRAGMEACDDGNQSNTDACLTTCVAASCGDGYTYAGTEDCDDQNNSNTDACLNTCKAASCGDGFIRTGMEACDDGNMIATDNCTATCTVATCGDGVVHAGVEECDDANQSNTDACVGSCKLAACGDGYIRTGVEVCDDGNLNNTDGCSNMCVSTTCGDGVVQAETEECDDGNMVDTDACRYNCADAACGDGVVRDGVEDCDDGNVVAGDGCSPACKVEGTGSGSGSDVDPGTPDDGGGCCQTSGGVGGSWLLALVVLGAIRRRRSRSPLVDCVRDPRPSCSS